MYINGVLIDDFVNKYIFDIIDDFVNLVEVSVSGGFDNEVFKDGFKGKEDGVGYFRFLLIIKKLVLFKVISVNKIFFY